MVIILLSGILKILLILSLENDANKFSSNEFSSLIFIPISKAYFFKISIFISCLLSLNWFNISFYKVFSFKLLIK